MIILKSRSEIEKMRKSNAIVAVILEELRKKIRPGVKTIELDRLSEELALKKGAGRPSRDTGLTPTPCARPSTARWCTGCPRTRS